MSDIIKTDKAPAAIGPYSQGTVLGGLVFTSGQLPIVVETGTMPDTIEEQAKASLENVKAILEAAGSSMNKVLKTTVFLSDMNNFAAFNAVYSTYFAEPFPARSCVQVARLPKDALVEIEAIAER
ncbi:RidA family protein [Desulfovibrio subterraneus]|jgi:2-iminobutanoate/2-iminopropanoate deaminase|uniref:Reactive intermediate/imine deaminase n=1 Tax=Desulfovibrio subterraneus TaxID=2718620 RepID=A0A7J0BHW9_9BACT|nr:RidA family protein [Desulfovibrio subterraneus]WBF66957.1 RidA family protein [Desulfovibrio subterraneus]GFM32684.1 reactive intermediate/imine deaminase [Desulfovibrio subterraneus]